MNATSLLALGVIWGVRSLAYGFESGAAPTLTATLFTPIIIDLNWKNTDPSVRGCLVEYTSDRAEDFVILAIAPADVTAFRHPDLAPKTPYFYRVRPYRGEASAVVEATTGKTPATDPMVPGDGEPITDPAGAGSKQSLRSPSTAALATPAEITAILPSPLSVALKWKDRASDEDGYLLECAGSGEADFHVIAFLPPDTIGFTVPKLPPETKCRFRVRAFFYGPSSNVVEKITGEEAPAGS